MNIPKHVFEGYKYCMEKGWEDVARVCMTHSYVLMQKEFNYKPASVEEKEIKQFILNCGEADDYDKLIQMCDALLTDYGFVILEKRFVDVGQRRQFEPCLRLYFSNLQRQRQSTYIQYVSIRFLVT